VTDTRSCIDEAALFVAAQDGAVDRIRAAHRPRSDGRCHACGADTRWPCVQVVIADRAEQLGTAG